jgi:hypothetical protein
MRDISAQLRRANNSVLAEIEEHDADATGHTGTDLDDIRRQAGDLWDNNNVFAVVSEAEKDAYRIHDGRRCRIQSRRVGRGRLAGATPGHAAIASP